MLHLAITTFGGFQVTLDGEELTRFESDKARALLVYLALEDAQPHRREALAHLLWPDYAEHQARHNLRQTLLRLRRVLGNDSVEPPFLLVSPQTMQFNTNSNYWFDVVAFRTALREAGHETLLIQKHSGDIEPQQVILLQHAVTLYRGDFLAQFFVDESLDFENWMLAQREELNNQIHAALECLTNYFLRHNDYGQAEQYVRRQLELDPLREESQRTLMQILMSTGQRTTALTRYETYRHLLHQELGVEPEDATVKLYEQIRADNVTKDSLDHKRAQKAKPSHDQMVSASMSTQHAERRQMTILCCDLVDMSDSSNETDPEVWHETLPFYRQLCLEVIEQFHGYLIEPRGRYLVAYFGYPQTHEDDARRAVQAGLALITHCGAQLTQRLPSTTAETHWGVRVSVHTGTAVVPKAGNIKERAQGIVGRVLDVSARLLDLTASQTVLISIATYRLVHRFFALQSLGTHLIAEAPRPLGIYQVLQEQDTQRYDDAIGNEVTTLVGREKQLDVLHTAWKQTEQQGHIVYLCGEAGIGKSRLTLEFGKSLQDRPHTWYTCHCSAYHQHTPFHVVITLLQQVLQFQDDDSLQDKVAKITHFLTQLSQIPGYQHMKGPHVIDLLTALLASSRVKYYPDFRLSSGQQRQQTLDILATLVRTGSMEQAVLLVVEDFHWADPSSLELLRYVSLDQPAINNLMIIITYRPELQLPWLPDTERTKQKDGPKIIDMNLDPLYDDEAGDLVKQAMGDATLPTTVIRQIVRRGDGIPLFVEELTRIIIEQVNEKRQPLSENQVDGRFKDALYQSVLDAYIVPDTLHDTLMARLDRLGSAKEIAQIAAVIGHEFQRSFLARLVCAGPNEQGVLQMSLSRTDEITLQDNLIALEKANILLHDGAADNPFYSFKHTLLQETAYHSMLTRTRQHYHRLIIKLLKTDNPNVMDHRPELLAQHYSAAGEIEAAITLWEQAGQQATNQSANAESITHFTKALELIQELPQTPEHIHHELTLLTRIGIPLVKIHGYGAEDVVRIYDRAYTLCQQVDASHQLVPVLRGLWTFYLSHADHRKATNIQQQLQQLTQQVADPTLIIMGHQITGFTLFCCGNMSHAHTHLAKAWELYEAHCTSSPQPPDMSELGVTILTELSHVLWFLGCSDTALHQSQNALRFAQRTGYPYNIGYALIKNAWLHRYLQDAESTQTYAEQAIQIAKEKEFPYWLTHGKILQGWSLAMQGQEELGIAIMRESLKEREQAGMLRARSEHMAMLSEAYAKSDQIGAALEVLDQAIHFSDIKGEQFYRAELYRLKGALLAQEGEDKEAELSLEEALQIARTQHAKIIELRAAMTFGHLQRSYGKSEDFERVATVFNSFTEGFNTADLQQAQDFLDS